MISKPTIDTNAIYSRAEAAHVLGVSLTTLKQLIRAGHLVVSQPTGIRRVFIKGTSILEMLERTTVTPAPARPAVTLSKSFASEPDYRAVSMAQPITQPALSWNSRGQLGSMALRSTKDTRAHPAATRAGTSRNSRARGGAKH